MTNPLWKWVQILQCTCGCGGWLFSFDAPQDRQALLARWCHHTVRVNSRMACTRCSHYVMTAEFVKQLPTWWQKQNQVVVVG